MKVDFRDIDINAELAVAEDSEIIVPSDHFQRLIDFRERRLTGIEMPWSKLAGRFRIYHGQLVMLGGYSGHFKTTISTQIALSAITQGYKVGIASLELEFPELMEQFLSIASGREQPPEDYSRKVFDFMRDKLWVYDKVDGIQPDEAIQMIIAFHKFRGCDLVILDALMMTGVCQDAKTEQDFSQTVAACAKRFGIAVLMLHHMRKPNAPEGEMKIPGKYDFIGSSHLVNIAHSLLIGWHNKKKASDMNNQMPYDDSEPDYVISVAKQRSQPYEGKVGLWQHQNSRAFCSDSRRFLEPLF